MIDRIEEQHQNSSFGQSSRSLRKLDLSSTPQLLLHKRDGDPRDGAFVYFRKLTARNAALQMIHAGKPYSIDVSPGKAYLS